MAKMSREELLKVITDTVYESLPDLQGTPLTEDTVINTDTGVDSMGMTLIICRLEANLGVRVPQKLWNKLFTIGDVVNAFYDRM